MAGNELRPFHADDAGGIAVSGAGGLVGSALTAALARDSVRIVRIVRGAAGGADEVAWRPGAGSLDGARLEGLDAVVHLAGENVASGRWSPKRKRRIRASRVEGTRLLAETLAALERPPRVLVNASAIGFYGDRGDETLGEDSAPGSGFLAETCVAWEQATEAARRAGIRVVRVRIGVVLSARGGALARMLPPFRLGLGGRVGSGRQFISWITSDDLVGVLRFCIERDDVEGPVNAVAPQPVRSTEFARTLGRVLRRPALLPLPAWVVRMFFGEMGRELLLGSARVLPRRLERAGFAFRHAALGPALEAVVGPSAGRSRT